MSDGVQVIRVEESFPKFGVCLRCHVEFEVGDWYCEDGKRHIVAPKTYRHTAAPQHLRHDENGHPLPDEERTIVTGDFPRVLPQWWTTSCYENYENMGGAAIFRNGRCETSDPQQQHILNGRPDYNATEDEWEAAWLSRSPEQVRETELQKREARLEQKKREVEFLRSRSQKGV